MLVGGLFMLGGGNSHHQKKTPDELEYERVKADAIFKLKPPQAFEVQFTSAPANRLSMADETGPSAELNFGSKAPEASVLRIIKRAARKAGWQYYGDNNWTKTYPGGKEMQLLLFVDKGRYFSGGISYALRVSEPPI